MRNVAAFHIDKKIIDAGLTNMLKDSGVVPLAEGDGRKNIRSQMPVGTLVLHAGLCWSSLDDYGEFIRIVDEGSISGKRGDSDGFHPSLRESRHPLPRKHRPVGQGRVKPLARLLRCATALRVTAPLGCGSRRPVWPKGSFWPVHTARMPRFGV